jgi:hypothetical protein
MREKGNGFLLVCSINDMLARLVWDQYIYKILPYPVNLKQVAIITYLTPL